MADEVLDQASSEASDVDILSEGANDEESTSEETPEVPEEEQESGGEGEETSEETPEEEETDEPAEEDEEDPDKLKAKEEEEEESEEEKITRPSWKRLIEKYPDAKNDKNLREMFYREKAFSDIFPTVEDAKSAGNKAQLMEYFDDQIAAARPEKLFEQIEPTILSRFARNIIPALHSIDQGIFVEATKPFIIKLLGDLKSQGVKTNDKNLIASVQNISKQVFGSFDLPEDINPDEHPEVKRRIAEVEREKEEGLNRIQGEFFADTDKSIKNQLSAVLRNGLDPENRLSEWARSAIIKQVLDETKIAIKNDQELIDRLSRIYQAARKSGFTNEYKPRFISAYLGRAKVIALGLRAKHRAAAIPRQAKNGKNRVENTRPEGKRETPQNSNRRPSGKKTDMEILLEGASD